MWLVATVLNNSPEHSEKWPRLGEMKKKGHPRDEGTASLKGKQWSSNGRWRSLQAASTRKATEARATGEDHPEPADLDSSISHNPLTACATNTGGKWLSFLNIMTADNVLTLLTRLPLCLDPPPSSSLSSVSSYTTALDYKLLCGQEPTHLCILSTQDLAPGSCDTAGLEQTAQQNCLAGVVHAGELEITKLGKWIKYLEY